MSSPRVSAVTAIRNVLTVDDEASLAEAVAQLAKSGDLVVGLGAGTITDWMNALPQRLAEQRARA